MQKYEMKKLDICFPPPIYYSLHVAISLSIIMANDENKEWFFNNFIQVSYYNEYSYGGNGHAFNIYPANETRAGQFAASQFLVEKHIDQRVAKFKRKDLFSNVIDFINNGYYVVCIADVSKLKGTRYENEKFFEHGMMIFGYDLTKRIFNILDFDNKNRINVIEIAFDDYLEAYESLELKLLWKLDINNTIILYERKQRKYTVDLEIVKELLYDYLNSYNTSKRYALILPCIQNSTWGIATYNKIIEYLKKVDDYIDYRIFHAFYEHKHIMLERFQYFYKAEIIYVGKNVLLQLEANRKYAEIIRMLVMKFNCKLDKDLVDRIIDNMNLVKEQEEKIYSKIIDIISEKISQQH